MKEEAIKVELHEKIDHADSDQLREIYGLVTNYLNGNDVDEEGWDTLSDYQKERIGKSIEQANAGLGTPAHDVIKNARAKYNLNG